MGKEESWLEQKKRFAGEKVPSMKRRSDVNDYSERNIYMVTLVIEGRRCLLGELQGTSLTPVFVPSKLGLAVHQCWQMIPEHYPHVKLIALQLMPDHLHAIIQVTSKMDCHLGQVINGFKIGCNRAYRALMAEAVPRPTGNCGSHSSYTGSHSSYTGSHSASGTNNGGSGSVQAEAVPRPTNKQAGLLFERGYNDVINKHFDMLPRLIQYVRSNPYRLLRRREQPDLFRVRFDVAIGGHNCSALGNIFLLDHPERVQVQCSRSLGDDAIQALVDKALAAARQGAVHVSPAISPGEKRVMRALLDAGFPLIFLVENGLTRYSKPGGQFFEACARGQLLIVAPWQHHNEHRVITRNQCSALNTLTWAICNTDSPIDN